MVIWLLVIVLIVPVPGIPTQTALERYESAEACQIDRAYVEQEMHNAYPDDHSFKIVCLERTET